MTYICHSHIVRLSNVINPFLYTDEDVTVKGKKRGYEEKEAEGGGDFTSEMHKMLNSFGGIYMIYITCI